MIIKIVAIKFKHCTNCIGYELFNEPWIGDFYKNPSLLIPGFADYYNLQPFYDKIHKAIRTIDDDHIILFESITMNLFGVGFTEVPGGKKYENKSILSYHYYNPVNPVLSFMYYMRMRDIKKLNCGGFLTEFSVGLLDNNINKMREVCDTADELLQSWSTWNYKIFDNITSDGSSFYNSDNTLRNSVYTLTRTYAQSVAGETISMNFNNDTHEFVLKYIPDPDIVLPTEIYLNENFHYPNGYRLIIKPSAWASFYYIQKNKLYIYHKNVQCDRINPYLTIMIKNNI